MLLYNHIDREAKLIDTAHRDYGDNAVNLMFFGWFAYARHDVLSMSELLKKSSQYIKN